MTESKPETTPFTFVGIGEVLFDIFEDGTETLGGAPLNFSVHIHQLASHFGAGQGIIVSSVNSDARGDKIIKSLEERKMSLQYIGRDENHSTGRVSVFMKNGEPGYQIEPEAAWDYIYDRPGLKDLAGQCSAICFGSLSQRCSVSRNTIRNFLANAPGAIRLYDVNLRQNTLTGEAGYSPEIIRYSCQAATVIKTNQSEFNTLFDILEIDCPSANSVEGLKSRMEIFLSRFPAEAVIVTRGDQGTLVLNKNGEFVLTKPGTINNPAHPVGAGDACSAGILFGLALGWDFYTTMELANRMGADVASHASATPPLSDETLNFAKAQLPGNKSG